LLKPKKKKKEKMNTVYNPMKITDQAGRVINPLDDHNRNKSLSSHIVLVDSRDRNLKLFTNANSFQIQLPREYRNVLSVQMLRVHMPVPTSLISTTDGIEPFVVIRCPQLKRVEQSGARITADIARNEFCEDAFALVPLGQETVYDTGKYTTIWEPRSYNVVKQFAPWGRLDRLDLSLWVRTNGTIVGESAYPFTAETAGARRENELNWQMLLEIVCQN
jgi:hypothetical protein